MSGFAEIMALGAFGNAIDNRTEKPLIRNENNKSRVESRNTRDIYSSNNSRKVRDNYENKARSRYRESRDFKNTKIIPRDYNRLDNFNKRNKHKKTIRKASVQCQSLFCSQSTAKEIMNSLFVFSYLRNAIFVFSRSICFSIPRFYFSVDLS